MNKVCLFATHSVNFVSHDPFELACLEQVVVSVRVLFAEAIILSSNFRFPLEKTDRQF